MAILPKKRDKIKEIAIDYFLMYSASKEYGTSFDFSKIPISIHEQNTNEAYLVVIESPEDDIFYSPLDIQFRDKAFIEIVNEKVITENPYSASAPMFYDESNIYIKRSGIYPGSIYFSEEITSIKESIIKHQFEIDLNKFSDIDFIIPNTEILDLFNTRGVFYATSKEIVCLVLFKRNHLTNRHYRLQVFYNIIEGTIDDIIIRDTTPPPSLC